MGQDAIITHLIVEEYARALCEHLELDVAVVGGGPSGLVCAYYLSRGGAKVALFERRLAPGGGIWGGGFGFSVIVLPTDVVDILEEMGVSFDRRDGYLVADAVAAGGALLASCSKVVRIFNNFTCEDLIIKDGRIRGVVFSASSNVVAGFHVDPISVEARTVVDATGHDAVLTRIAVRHLKDGTISGEGPMNAEEGERFVVENTGMVFDGLYVCGMAVNAVRGGARMGPIFGGMLKSGRRCAELILDELLK